MRVSRSALAVLLLAACSGGQTPGAITPSFGTTSMGLSRPDWAKSGLWVGKVSGAERLSFQVHLRMRNEQAAAAELADISNPDSPRFGRYLSNDEFNAKYAPTEADVAQVRGYLQGQGLVVTSVPENRGFLSVEGPASQVEGAFGTQLGLYKVGADTRRAPTGALSLPASVAPRVLAVLGVATSPKMKPAHLRRSALTGPLASGRASPPCSEWFGQLPDIFDPTLGTGWSPLTILPCGYHPGQLRQAYGFARLVRQGIDGTGTRIAIVDAFQSPTLLADAQTYAANNDPDYPLASSQFSARMAPGVPDLVDTSWFLEQSLDVEAVHAMAPGATIVYVGAQSATDLNLASAINLVLSKGLASIISNSWGSPEAAPNDFVVFHALATQAGLKGIGLYFSSGDSGDNARNFGFPNPGFPASLDNVTGVGGTSLAIGAQGTRLWESGWETGVTALDTSVVDAGVWSPAAPGQFIFGAGGGTSNVYEQPAWQKGIVPPALANIPGTPARVEPDVAMLADPVTGFVIGASDPNASPAQYSELTIGGTSVACPLFAGTMALAQQYTKHRMGFANPRLYKVHAAAFRDILPAQNKAVAIPGGGVAATFDFPGISLHTTPGYDNVTGLGAPNGIQFLNALR